MHILAIEEYGLRCLLRVARLEAIGPVTGREIARAEGLRPGHVDQIMRSLRADGLVLSTRAAPKGHRLSRPAREISVWQAIQAVGGEFFPTGICDCHPDERGVCVHVTDCSARSLWQKVEATLREALDTVSLEALLQDEPSFDRPLETKEGPRPTSSIDHYGGD